MFQEKKFTALLDANTTMHSQSYIKNREVRQKSTNSQDATRLVDMKVPVGLTLKKSSQKLKPSFSFSDLKKTQQTQANEKKSKKNAEDRVRELSKHRQSSKNSTKSDNIKRTPKGNKFVAAVSSQRPTHSRNFKSSSSMALESIYRRKSFLNQQSLGANKAESSAHNSSLTMNDKMRYLRLSENRYNRGLFKQGQTTEGHSEISDSDSKQKLQSIFMTYPNQNDEFLTNNLARGKTDHLVQSKLSKKTDFLENLRSIRVKEPDKPKGELETSKKGKMKLYAIHHSSQQSYNSNKSYKTYKSANPNSNKQTITKEQLVSNLKRGIFKDAKSFFESKFKKKKSVNPQDDQERVSGQAARLSHPVGSIDFKNLNSEFLTTGDISQKVPESSRSNIVGDSAKLSRIEYILEKSSQKHEQIQRPLAPTLVGPDFQKSASKKFAFHKLISPLETKSVFKDKKEKVNGEFDSWQHRSLTKAKNDNTTSIAQLLQEQRLRSATNGSSKGYLDVLNKQKWFSSIQKQTCLDNMSTST